MAFNLVKLENDLKGAPDEALIGYVQNPTGQVPTYLALSELERRKRMREGAQAQQYDSEQPSVAEQLVSEAAPMEAQGVASLPMPQDMYTAAEGGIVGYNNGGVVAFSEGKKVTPPHTKSYWLEQDRATKEREMWIRKAWNSILNKTGTPSSWRHSLTGGHMGSPLELGDPQVEYDEYMYNIYNPKVAELQADKDAIRAARDAKFFPPVTSNEVAPAEGEAESDQGLAGLPTSTPRKQPSPEDRGGPSNVRGYQPPNFLEGLGALYTAPEDLSEQFKVTPAANALDERDRYLAMVGQDPFQTKGADRLAKMEERDARLEQQAPWMALAEAGFTAAAGQSPFALANLGEGGKKFVESFGKAQERAAAAEERRFDLESKLSEKQRAEELAAATFGFNSEQAQQTREDRQRTAKLEYKAQRESDIAKSKFEEKKTILEVKTNMESLRLKDKQINATLEAAKQQVKAMENQANKTLWGAQLKAYGDEAKILLKQFEVLERKDLLGMEPELIKEHNNKINGISSKLEDLAKKINAFNNRLSFGSDDIPDDIKEIIGSVPKGQ